MSKDEALKLARRALYFAHDDGYSNELSHEAITAIKAALEAKDEPVAWRALNWGHSPDEYVYRDFDDPVMGIDGKPSPNNEPLYTTPPQRKPLTDEGIERLWPMRPTDDVINFARAIEAAHGIKGEA